MAAGRNRVQRVARFRYEDFAFADHLELISLHHNDCVGIDADAEQRVLSEAGRAKIALTRTWSALFLISQG